MKVRNLMSTNTESCRPTTSLTDAALAMWRRDCGIVPVVDPSDGKAVGVITDRDICIATATRHRSPDEILVGDVMHGDVQTCRPEEDVRDALQTMQQHQIRRLPVVDARGGLVGMLSLNDVVRHARPAGKKGALIVQSEDVIDAYKAVSKPYGDGAGVPRLPESVEVAGGPRA